MATQLTLRKGTKIQNDAFTGAEAELTYVSTSKGLRVHDGNTQGGIEVPTANTADYVIESQLPTADNDYIWYRKYKSGWVEQGCLSVRDNETFSFPIQMANTNYSVMALAKVGTGEVKAASVREDLKTVNGCIVYFTSSNYYGYIEIKGMAA